MEKLQHTEFVKFVAEVKAKIQKARLISLKMSKHILYFLFLFPFFLNAQEYLELDSITNSIIQKENKSTVEIDKLLSILNSYYIYYNQQVIILKELKKDKRWNHSDWEKYRILDSALACYTNNEFEEALPYFKKHISLGDETKQIFSMNQSEGTIC